MNHVRPRPGPARVARFHAPHALLVPLTLLERAEARGATTPRLMSAAAASWAALRAMHIRLARVG